MPQGNARRKHKMVVVFDFDEKVNEREAVDAINESWKGDSFYTTITRKREGKRGEYEAFEARVKVIRAERGDL